MARSQAEMRVVGAPIPAKSRARRTYTDAFKADAVAKARAAQSVAQVSKALGIARNTLAGWMREAPAAPMSLLEAVRSGDRKLTLIALRDDLASSIAAGMSARDKPPNVRLLNETMRELEEIKAREAEEAADAASAPDEDLDPDDL